MRERPPDRDAPHAALREPPPPRPPAPPRVASPGYAELAVTSNFTFLTGGSHPEEYVEAAADLGLAGIGLADRNTLAGIVRAHTAAKEKGVRFAVGCRLGFADGTADVLAYPADRAAYGRLCRMLTAANLKGEKGSPDLGLGDLLAVLAEEAEEGNGVGGEAGTGGGIAAGAPGSGPATGSVRTGLPQSAGTGRGLHLVALPPPRPGASLDRKSVV